MTDGRKPGLGHQNHGNWMEQSPVEPRADHSGYFPNTEHLGPDEMRVIILGSGMPNPRKSQASASVLVALGNGDKFIFDVGSESAANLGALEIPYDWVDKVFISHLHQDHFADIVALWIGGWTGGRHGPLRIWGPSGDKPELGTKACVEGFKASRMWDVTSRLGEIPDGGGELEVHEFDYLGENQVVFEENGVTVRSFPAVHAIDGAVSYSLEWNGLKFVFGGDTYPNKWYVEYSKGADIAVHESFLPPPLLVTKQGFNPLEALTVGTQGHTSPEQFGKVMSMVEPRLAVGYHFYNDFDIKPEMMKRIRKLYDGPLELAVDYMVFNVTKDSIKTRMSAVDEEIWPSPPIREKIPPDVSDIPFSAFTISGALPMLEVVQPLYDEINDMYGTDYEPFFKPKDPAE